MTRLVSEKLSRQQIDRWPIENSGLSARVVHCMNKAKVGTVGELRNWSDEKLLALRSFGVVSVKDVRNFFRWTDRLEAGDAVLPDLRTWMREFLRPQEVFVLERRFGLRDPEFRPGERRMTLQQIANRQGGLTRERARQVEESGLLSLQSYLARSVGMPLERHFADKILAKGGAVTSEELNSWSNDPILGGYQPWGAMMLLSETLKGISCRNGYFTTLPEKQLLQVEKQALQQLDSSGEPVPAQKIIRAVSGALKDQKVNTAQIVDVVLGQHPDVSSTTAGEYFVTTKGASRVLTKILREQKKPAHFHALTKLYNKQMRPQSQKGTGYILRELTLMKNAQKSERGLYSLKSK